MTSLTKRWLSIQVKCRRFLKIIQSLQFYNILFEKLWIHKKRLGEIPSLVISSLIIYACPKRLSTS
jgi:hypothetical protein